MDCSTLKVGDKVAVFSMSMNGRYCIFDTVEKVNKLTVQVRGLKFNKHDGYQKGGESWNRKWLDTVENGRKILKEQRLLYLDACINRAIKELGLKPSPELINDLLAIVEKYK